MNDFFSSIGYSHFHGYKSWSWSTSRCIWLPHRINK